MHRTAKLLRLMAHPVRAAMLDRMAKSRQPMSAKDLRLALGGGLSPGSACYHVKVLRQAGLLVLVESVPRRGSTELYYRLTPAARRFVEAAGVLADASEQAARIIESPRAACGGRRSRRTGAVARCAGRARRASRRARAAACRTCSATCLRCRCCAGTGRDFEIRLGRGPWHAIEATPEEVAEAVRGGMAGPGMIRRGAAMRAAREARGLPVVAG